MKSCVQCNAELPDGTQYCTVCGASQVTSATRFASSQQLMLPKTVFYILMIALALMGLAVVGLAVRGPNTPSVSVQTQVNYVTQMQYTTYTVSYATTETQIQPYTFTVGSATTQAASPPPIWFNNQYCGYPFNPYLCNEGPPATLNGYLTSDGTCVDLSVVSGVTYVVWNLNGHPANSTYASYVASLSAYINKGVQVYGFVYPNWPPTQPFPPYPFQTSICVGVPVWTIAPYIQSFS